MRIGRLTTLVVVMLGIVWAPQIARFPSLWQYPQSILAYLTPPIAACFLFGVLWRQANVPGAVAALGTGLALAIGLLVSSVEIHFLYVAALVFAASAVAMVAASLMTAPPSDNTAELVWAPGLGQAGSGVREPLPWHPDYRIYAAGLLVATAVIVGIYW